MEAEEHFTKAFREEHENIFTLSVKYNQNATS